MAFRRSFRNLSQDGSTNRLRIRISFHLVSIDIDKISMNNYYETVLTERWHNVFHSEMIFTQINCKFCISRIVLQIWPLDGTTGRCMPDSEPIEAATVVHYTLSFWHPPRKDEPAPLFSDLQFDFKLNWRPENSNWH